MNQFILFVAVTTKLLQEVKIDSKQFDEIAQIVTKGCLNTTSQQKDGNGDVCVKRCKLVNNIKLTKAVVFNFIYKSNSMIIV
jgi:hypothetical protein